MHELITLSKMSMSPTNKTADARACPMCGTQLRPKQKTCKAACRQALARHIRKYGDIPVSAVSVFVAVARRQRRLSLLDKQREARRKLRIIHAKRRKEMQAYCLGERLAMKMELAQSDKNVAAQHDAEILKAGRDGTLPAQIAAEDRKKLRPFEIRRSVTSGA